MSRVLPILFNTEMVQANLDDRKTATRRLIKPRYQGNECNFLVMTNKATGERRIDTVDADGYVCRTGIKPPYQPGDILYVRETWAFISCIECNRNYLPKGKPLNCYDTQAIEYDDGDSISDGCFFYRADYPHPERITWRPSIHMPKAAARIWLRVTDVRVEQLQEITEEQATREGITRLYDDLSDAEYIDWTKRTGIYPKAKAEWGYKNYLWHGNFGAHGAGNKLSDTWEYQYSSYDSAIGSFSSLWNLTVPLKDWNVYGWNANPWVWTIEFERCEKPENEE